MSRSRLRRLSDCLCQLDRCYVGYNGRSIFGSHRFFSNQSLSLDRVPVRDVNGTKPHRGPGFIFSHNIDWEVYNYSTDPHFS